MFTNAYTKPFSILKLNSPKSIHILSQDLALAKIDSFIKLIWNSE